MMIRVLTTSYNGAKYIPKTIASLKSQTVQDWKCYITDDMSTDNSIEVAQKAINGDKRFQIILNIQKMWQTGNYWQVLQKEEINDQDICLTLDGDDWFPDTQVLERVNNYYKDEKLWVSFGQFIYYIGNNRYKPGFTKPPASGIAHQRNDPFTTTHLRTWKAWLFRKIQLATLKDDQGKFIPMAGDLCFMWPMLEMAGEKHSRFVTDINYVYNEETDLNECKVNIQGVMACDRISRNRAPYPRLD